MIKYSLAFTILFSITSLLGQETLNNQKIDGYKGIWFTLGQFSTKYGDKYSGGLGTYTAKHRPLAIYAPEVDKTFFVYGGTTEADEKHLLCMISYYDHKTGKLPKPTVVFDKSGVDDPHDNPSLLIDKDGFLWVFVSGRGRTRPGYKYKSILPYNVTSFVKITEEEMTYPQPLYIKNKGFFNFFTKYTGVRELYFETSKDGKSWTSDVKLAGIVEKGATKSGHYQVSGQHEKVVSTFFSRHPDGNVDRRTDLYYVQSTDFGATWTTTTGEIISPPLTTVNSKARVFDYTSLRKNVYLKDMNFDRNGNPVCLYLTSNGHRPGPEDGPRDWKITRFDGNHWQTKTLFQSDHNYDMGSLYIDGARWMIIAPSNPGPQEHHTGGEIVVWESLDDGNSWKIKHQLTKDSEANHNYTRRPRNAKDPFLVFWADGDSGAFSKSRLYFADSLGTVYRLPYVMTADQAIPTKLE